MRYYIKLGRECEILIHLYFLFALILIRFGPEQDIRRALRCLLILQNRANRLILY